MEYFNKKRPIYSTIISFVLFVILSLVIHQGKDILHWVILSFIFACIVGVISLRISIQDAKNRKEFEEIKQQELKQQIGEEHGKETSAKEENKYETKNEKNEEN